MYAALAARGRVGFPATGTVERAVGPPRERGHADSDDVAQAFRDDLAHRSDRMSPGVAR